MLTERLPKRVLSGHTDGSGVRGRSQKQWVLPMDQVREDLQLQGFLLYGVGIPMTGQAGGLPYYIYCNTPEVLSAD